MAKWEKKGFSNHLSTLLTAIVRTVINIWKQDFKLIDILLSHNAKRDVEETF